ncbi:hypothetical protein CKN80_07845 [Carnobacterium divergens]|uniref:hypothetical protein n=1 Tax=Carnobacterium divergens TaxID=2748 RepID=UPI0010719B4D|nr:hypothetical protein [Carnobacterium divergens]TFJ44230.1 hypothetical protein CKN79_09400 [Carnobacterium divergens]TFJ50874.1 hypothetical protein CKN80_07845 [Carnobacterium divergens]
MLRKTKIRKLSVFSLSILEIIQEANQESNVVLALFQLLKLFDSLNLAMIVDKNLFIRKNEQQDQEILIYEILDMELLNPLVHYILFFEEEEDSQSYKLKEEVMSLLLHHGIDFKKLSEEEFPKELFDQKKIVSIFETFLSTI